MDNLTSGFWRQVREHPELPALFVDERWYSYGEVGQAAASVANWTSRVCGRGQRVGVFATRTYSSYTAILGILTAGCAYVPVNPTAPAVRTRAMLAEGALAAFVAKEEDERFSRSSVLEKLPRDILFTDGILKGEHDKFAGPVDCGPGETAYLMFTSGSTGVPKGIAVTVGNLTHFLSVMKERYRPGPGERFSGFNALIFDISVFDLMMAFSSGAALCVVPEQELLCPVDFIRRMELTTWFSVPSVIGFAVSLGKLEKGSMPSLKWSLFAGEAFPAEAAVKWGEAAPNSIVENLYGPTEVTVTCLVKRFTGEADATPGRGVVPIGKPLAGLKGSVLGPDLKPLGANAEGELALCGPQVVPGYFRNAQLTAERFVKIGEGDETWYLTGDRVYQDENGDYHFLGRVDNQVKIRGHRVELDEIEHHLRVLTGATNVTVVRHPSEGETCTRVNAAVEARAIEERALKRKLRELLPGYMIPAKIIAVEELPRGATGKIDRKAAAKLFD